MIRSRMTTSPVDQPRTDAREGPLRWERWSAARTRRLQWAVGSLYDDLFTGHTDYYEWCGSTWTQSSSTFKLFGKGDFCSCVLFSSPFQDSKILKPGCWPRPPVNYCILIALALKSSHSGSLKVQQIYHFTRSEDDLLEPRRFMFTRIKCWRLTCLQTAHVFIFCRSDRLHMDAAPLKIRL